MDKENELKFLTDIVKKVLEEQEHTRDNNWELYYEVCKFISPSAMTSKFGTVLRSHDVFCLPGFESVARARRKVVEKHPELLGNEEVEGGRWSYEKAYRKFARAKA